MKRFGMLILVMLVFQACAKRETGWTTWRGPAGRGATAESDWKSESILDAGNILWRANVGSGHASVTIQKNRLYTMGQKVAIMGSDTTYDAAIWCLDNRTGALLWKHGYASGKQAWPGPGSTPVIDGDRVYAVNREGRVFCLDALSGDAIWTRHMAQENLGAAPFGESGYNFSCLVAGDRLILNAGDHGLCLDKHDGSTLWHSAPGKGGHASPVLLEGGRQVMVSTEEKMTLVDVATGELVWEQPWGGWLDPIDLGDGRVFIARREGIQCLKIDGAKTQVLWDSKETLPHSFLNFTALGQYAFGYNRKGRNQSLQCINLENAEVAWEVDCDPWGALIVAGDRLIVLDGDGDLSIVRATTEAYTELASSQLFDLKKWDEVDRSVPLDLIESCWINPVLSQGKLYARTTHGNLVCIDLS